MAYIIDGLRSYIGIENSMYRHISAEQLGAGVLDRLAERTGIYLSCVTVIFFSSIVKNMIFDFFSLSNHLTGLLFAV